GRALISAGFQNFAQLGMQRRQVGRDRILWSRVAEERENGRFEIGLPDIAFRRNHKFKRLALQLLQALQIALGRLASTSSPPTICAFIQDDRAHEAVVDHARLDPRRFGPNYCFRPDLQYVLLDLAGPSCCQTEVVAGVPFLAGQPGQGDGNTLVRLIGKIVRDSLLLRLIDPITAEIEEHPIGILELPAELALDHIVFGQPLNRCLRLVGGAGRSPRQRGLAGHQAAGAAIPGRPLGRGIPGVARAGGLPLPLGPSPPYFPPRPLPATTCFAARSSGFPIPNLALSTGDRMIFCTVRLPRVVCKRSTLLPTESVAGESGLAVVGGIDAGLLTAAFSVAVWASILMARHSYSGRSVNKAMRGRTSNARVVPSPGTCRGS